MFNLSAVEQYTLARPPLAQALAQVRFPLLAKLQTFEGITPLQEALTAQFPYMDRVFEAALAIALGEGMPRSEQTSSWHFKDDDDRLLIVRPDSMTLSLGSQYKGFADLRERFEGALKALEASLAPRRCTQVGVRFFNILEIIDDQRAPWKNIFNPNIVGWPASQIVHGDTRLQASISQIQLVSPPVNELASFPAEIQSVIRHGVAPQGTAAPGVPIIQFDNESFFLDIDMFVTATQEFAIPRILQQFAIMHSQIDRFFRWSLTDVGESYFELTEGK